MIRIICGLRLEDHTNLKRIREKIKMMSVNQIAIYHILLEGYQILKNSASEPILQKWRDISENDRVLRSNTNKVLKVPKKPAVKCTGFTYFGSKLMNMLPSHIRNTQNPTTFKNLTKEWIWNEIPSY